MTRRIPGGDGIRARASSWLRRMSAKSFRLGRAYWRYRLRRQMQGEGLPLLVYQMGKVGSKSVVDTLRAVRPDTAVKHVHFLSPGAIEYFEDFARGCFERDLVSDASRINNMRHLAQAEYLYDRLSQPETHGSWRAITMVRDPVARNVSGFFEILDLQMGYGLAEQLERRGRDAVLRELPRMFMDEFPDHEVPLAFFDKEVKRVLDIDVFDTPFASERGYQIYQSDIAELLLIRLEDLDSVAPTALREFLGVDVGGLKRSNVGRQKWNGDLYEDFRGDLILPETYLDRMYGSQLATHFYTQDELRGFRERWRE